jgi:hypothetical protein
MIILKCSLIKEGLSLANGRVTGHFLILLLVVLKLANTLGLTVHAER